jgi:hypothetical protein
MMGPWRNHLLSQYHRFFLYQTNASNPSAVLWLMW